MERDLRARSKCRSGFQGLEIKLLDYGTPSPRHPDLIKSLQQVEAFLATSPNSFGGALIALNLNIAVAMDA